MADPVLTTDQIADRLLKIFNPVFDAWQKWDKARPALQDEVDSLTMADILEEDIMMLGLFIVGSDSRAAQIELGAVIDCMASLRSRGDEDFTEHDEEMIAEELRIVQESLADTPAELATQEMDLPLSLRIAMDYYRGGFKVNLTGLREAFAQFIHVLILRDGNVTADEIALAKEMEQMLNTLSAEV